MIIAICGLKRCGKDTVAEYLVQRYAHKFRHVKIAAPLKEVCGLLFGWSAQHMEDDNKDAVDPAWGISPRAALQFVGTEMMQYKIQELLGPGIGRTFWIRSFIMSLQPNESVIISDMRFVHEYDMLKAAFGSRLLTIKVTKQGATDDDAHCSEQEWKQIDHDILIENNGTLQQLYKTLDKLNLTRC